jgi:hypothetical protein
MSRFPRTLWRRTRVDGECVRRSVVDGGAVGWSNDVGLWFGRIFAIAPRATPSGNAGDESWST